MDVFPGATWMLADPEETEILADKEATGMLADSEVKGLEMAPRSAGMLATLKRSIGGGLGGNLDTGGPRGDQVGVSPEGDRDAGGHGGDQDARGTKRRLGWRRTLCLFLPLSLLRSDQNLNRQLLNIDIVIEYLHLK